MAMLFLVSTHVIKFPFDPDYFISLNHCSIDCSTSQDSNGVRWLKPAYSCPEMTDEVRNSVPIGVFAISLTKPQALFAARSPKGQRIAVDSKRCVKYVGRQYGNFNITLFSQVNRRQEEILKSALGTQIGISI